MRIRRSRRSSTWRRSRVGWVERSETHQFLRGTMMGFASLYPSYDPALHGVVLALLVQSHLPCFPAEHRLLAGDAPVIAGQCAALAERTMAGHHERHRIASDRG